MSRHLYTQKEVTEVREILLKEQEGQDALTGLMLEKNPCLDHDHVSQYCRGTLERGVNQAVGLLEGAYRRYLRDYPYDLPTFLRQAADYLELEPDTRFIHTGFLKKSRSLFNALNESQKTQVLFRMGQGMQPNAKARKEVFNQCLLSREYTYDSIKNSIQTVKESE